MKEKKTEEKEETKGAPASKKRLQLSRKFRNWSLMKEQKQDLTNFLQADNYLKKLPGRTQESVKRAYKKIINYYYLFTYSINLN